MDLCPAVARQVFFHERNGGKGKFFVCLSEFKAGFYAIQEWK